MATNVSFAGGPLSGETQERDWESFFVTLNSTGEPTALTLRESDLYVLSYTDSATETAFYVWDERITPA